MTTGAYLHELGYQLMASFTKHRQVLFQFSLSCLKHLQVSPVVLSGTLIPPIYRWTFFSSRFTRKILFHILVRLPIDGIFHIFSKFFSLSVLKMVISGNNWKKFLPMMTGGMSLFIHSEKKRICWPGRGYIATHTLVHISPQPWS